jgi:hypothetical protein
MTSGLSSYVSLRASRRWRRAPRPLFPTLEARGDRSAVHDRIVDDEDPDLLFNGSSPLPRARQERTV